VSPACRQAGVRLEGFIVDVSRREEGDLHSLLTVSGAVRGLITVVEHENVTSFGLCPDSRLNVGFSCLNEEAIFSITIRLNLLRPQN